MTEIEHDAVSIDPNDMKLTLLEMVTLTFEAIVADPDVTMEVIEQIAFLSRIRDNDDKEHAELRSKCLDDLAELVCEAVSDSYDREIDKEAAQ